MTTAVMIGATGLVGSQLLRQLVDDPRFTKVTVLGRRASGVSSPKVTEHVIDFDATDSWAPLVKGDVAFSALGTTAKQAGSKEVQKKVDHDYQLEFAKAASRNGVASFVLVSSASANASSSVFYSRIKGELDQQVQALPFERVRIMRPSLLGGVRKDPRLGETFGSAMLGFVNAIGIARKWREIGGDVVAQAMINSAFDPATGTRIFTLDQVFAAAESSQETRR